jgi:ABC-type Zn uptake system ZnuABC Zn-binding protein ZnuA
MRKSQLIIILVIGLLFLSACNAEPQQDSGKLSVVATTNIIGDVVANIGGEAIELTVLIGIGQNPHSFEPTPQDLAAIETANLVFVNGLDLEEVLVDAIDETATGTVIAVSDGIEFLAFGEAEHDDHDDHDEADHDDHDEAEHDNHDEAEHDDHDEAEHDDHDGHDHANDPHFWMDPNNVIAWAENIAEALIDADPANADAYQANADAYIVGLQAVDAYIREQTSKIHEHDRKIVTDHQTLGYFAEEYGYEIVGAVIPGTTDSGGASAGEVAELAELMQAEEVKTIFIGESAGQGMQDLAQALADEIGGEVQIISILTGSLAPEGQEGDTYLGFLRYNIDKIVAGLSD